MTDYKDSVRAKPWTGENPPSKILVMRFQALGDTVITLPYLQSLKRQYPQIELHFLTREEVSPIPASIALFDKIITIGGGRNAKAQFAWALLKLPVLLLQRYDAVLDLQNHKISRVVRKLLFTKAWSEFIIDRRTTLPAGERTKLTIEALWRWKIKPDTRFEVQSQDALALLRENGWKPDHDLVVLNPAGAFTSRNWPLDHYIAFSKLWLQGKPKTQFVLLLLPSLSEKAAYIAKGLGESCINLTGKANQVEAFAVLQRCAFVLSEDGGLMHMAWVQGVPTLALFGSSRSDWSSPQGAWSRCLHSADLPCGNCQLEICKFGDVHCLTRYTPQEVMREAELLLNAAKQ
jgi:heptosyltransferase II